MLYSLRRLFPPAWCDEWIPGVVALRASHCITQKRNFKNDENLVAIAQCTLGIRLPTKTVRMASTSRLVLTLGAVGFQSVWSWQAIVSPSLRLVQPSTVSSRAFRTMLGSSSLTESMTDTLAETMGVEPAEKGARFKVGGGGYGGGGGASVGTIIDNVTGDKYFYKKAAGSDGSMLAAERAGLQAMCDAEAIRVPRPICGGEASGGSFAVFEYLDMGGQASSDKSELMGVQLARMHRRLSANGMYGFDIDNTIGATPQPNGWMESWVDFWIERRLKHMLRLSEKSGGVFQNTSQLIEKTRSLLSEHKAPPSLVHGDLWGGNQGFVAPLNEPVIFDPATYYGDREVDLAMTRVFGGFPAAFYRGYQKEWPLEPGHEKRQVVYNLYHILNHHVLFGGGYLGSAQRMIGQILQM